MLNQAKLVNPGREVLTISDLARVDLKIFVDETEIGKVRPGQKVDVKVDTFPVNLYRIGFFCFSGRRIYSENHSDEKERVKLVYLVKVSIVNPKL